MNRLRLCATIRTATVPCGAVPCGAGLLAMAICLLSIADVQAAKPSDQLLPAGTRLYWRLVEPQQVKQQFAGTQVGKLFDDPQMQPFVAEANRNLDGGIDKFVNSQLTLSELLELSDQELAGAVVEMAPRVPASVVFAQVGKHRARADALVQEAYRRLSAESWARTQQALPTGETATIFTSRDAQPRRCVFLFKEDALIVADNLELTADIVNRWSTDGPCLAKLPEYQDSLKRSLAEADPHRPHAQAFIKPVEYILLTEQLEPDEDPDETPFLHKHGFKAVQGIGVYAGLLEAPYDAVIRASVYAPGPYQNGMKMLKFVPGQQYEPKAWVPNNINSFTSLYWSVPDIFDNLSGVFDDLIGDGLEGTFNDIISDLKAADGPGVDVRKELVTLLGPRISVIGDALTPVTAVSERTVVAIEAKDEQKVAEAIKALLRDDPDVQRLRLEGFENDLWQIGQDNFDTADEGELKFSSSAIIVAHGHLLFATHFDAIKKYIGRAAPEGGLAVASDYAAVLKQLNQVHNGPEVFVKVFSRLDQDLMTTFELLRQGKAEDAESIYGMLLRMLLDAEEGSSLDYAKLPEYKHIRHYLGLSGLIGSNHDQGWQFQSLFLAPPE